MDLHMIQPFDFQVFTKMTQTLKFFTAINIKSNTFLSREATL